MTYDVAFAGPKNRYTIATSAGPVIVHNCGFGVGAAKLRAALKSSAMPVDVGDDAARTIVATYRSTYDRIPAIWKQGDKAIDAMARDCTAPLGLDGVLDVQGSRGIRLPNGLYLQYPNLRREADDEGKESWVYDGKRGRATIKKYLWGGSLCENYTSALARIIVAGQMLKIARRYRVVMTVHDSVVALAPEAEAEEATAYIMACMRERPSWAAGLPLNCEAGYGANYGDC